MGYLSNGNRKQKAKAFPGYMQKRLNTWPQGTKSPRVRKTTGVHLGVQQLRGLLPFSEWKLVE